jgi:hypothetical protein
MTTQAKILAFDLREANPPGCNRLLVAAEALLVDRGAVFY